MKYKNLIFALLSISLMNGCVDTQSQMQRSALIGAASGALVGQAIGGDTKSTLIGTAIGATSGALIGNQMNNNTQCYCDKYGNMYYIDRNRKRYYK